jgi:hypothetical protein
MVPAIFGCYLLVHAIAFVLVLRHLATFSSEKAMFLYHAAPATLLSLSLFSWWLVNPDTVAFALAVSIIAAQGIYSMSFLELWSLAEGGYSLSILDRIDRTLTTGESLNQVELERIGEVKKTNRLRSLRDLALVRDDQGGLRLTPVGRCIAAFLAAAAWPANPKRAR